MATTTSRLEHVPLTPGIDFFAELEKAIKDERYEDAAIIRDSIKALANAISEFETEPATS